MGRVALLVILLAGLLTACEEAKPPKLPKLGDLNAHVVAVMATYPTDGTHAYWWPKSGSWAGNVRTLKYDGEVLLEGDPKGRCYCCGLTFEVFLQAFERWCKEVERPYRILAMKAKDVLRLKHEWFGSNGDRSTLHGAIVNNGLGVRITKWRDAREGDFVQLWRHNGSGHSVVFLRWKKKSGKIVGLTYWSTQKSTNGIGERTELFGYEGSTLKRDELYLCRVGDPKGV
jgi:hypothetical protein